MKQKYGTKGEKQNKPTIHANCCFCAIAIPFPTLLPLHYYVPLLLLLLPLGLSQAPGLPARAVDGAGKGAETLSIVAWA
jgi:hypothetical protein